MSATLSLMLKLIDPSTKIIIFERLNAVAEESSAAINNAGTGYSALCELNYTPQKEDGSIDVTKAKAIFQQFEQSKVFWSFPVQQKFIDDPQTFIHSIPHHNWVRGEKDVEFLQKRFEAMKQHFMFDSMKYSEEFEILKPWFPLIMQQRSSNEKMAATRMEIGTGVNFGALTRQYIKILKEEFDTPVLREMEVADVDTASESEWLAEVKNLYTNEKTYFDAKHVFIGAGGGALSLLQKV